jgi:hypothetical protein
MFIRLSKMLMGKHALAGKAMAPGDPGKRALPEGRTREQLLVTLALWQVAVGSNFDPTSSPRFESLIRRDNAR